MPSFHNDEYQTGIRKLFDATSDKAFLKQQVDFPEATDSETRAAVDVLIQRTLEMLKATIELSTTIDDMIITHQMLSRYPWHGTEISKAKHLDLSFFLFQNLCYRFKEKLKLVFNAQRSASKIVGIEEPVWLRFELRNVERSVGEHIRDRGNTIHSWDAKNATINFFSLVETYSIFSQKGMETASDDPLLDVKAHYSDAKWELKDISKSSIIACVECIGRILGKHDPSPAYVANKTLDIIRKVERSEIRLSMR